MNDVGTSYLLWLVWIFGAAGLHRLYNKKFVTGILWFCTWGLFGVGQIIDLFLIPEMVRDHNNRVRQRLGVTPSGIPLSQANVEVVIQEPLVVQPRLTQEALMIKLLKAAQVRGGKLSVTQGVLDTEASFAEVEAALQAMVTSGYVTVGNDPMTGIITYDFIEL